MEFNFYPFDLVSSDFEKIKYKNRCVIFPTESAPSWRAPCGYIVLKKTDVPSDWWGNYNAPGLQRLKIHGGLTYCRQAMVPNQTEIEKVYAEKIKQLPSGMDRLKKIMEIDVELNAELSKTSEGYVVFGFDCGHYGDDENEKLKDPNHVMMLTEQMESQLLKFAEVYDDYKNANDAIKDVVQKTIMSNIHREADIPCEMGFGALLEILKNGGED